ncbi:NAD(P)-binding protein [Hypomontagnella monticulosa]|nr:NAD(P)-binding protein [Hypomontagnella monticulosa]
MPAIFIIGAGPNVGKATAEVFSAAGYKVALASRSNQVGGNYRHYTFDATKPDDLPAVFEQVEKDVGIPSVVVYNAAKGGQTKTDEPFQDMDFFRANLNINTVSPFVAAREAIKGFDKLGASGLGHSGGTFIFTGNLLNKTAVQGLMSFGMQKGAGAHMIQYLALVAFKDKPYKFYYPDERRPGGHYVTNDLNGKGHADLFLDLAKDPKQRPWNQTFVTGEGYQVFPSPEAMTWDG